MRGAAALLLVAIVGCSSPTDKGITACEKLVQLGKDRPPLPETYERLAAIGTLATGSKLEALRQAGANAEAAGRAGSAIMATDPAGAEEAAAQAVTHLDKVCRDSKTYRP